MVFCGLPSLYGSGSHGLGHTSWYLGQAEVVFGWWDLWGCCGEGYATMCIKGKCVPSCSDRSLRAMGALGTKNNDRELWVNHRQGIGLGPWVYVGLRWPNDLLRRRKQCLRIGGQLLGLQIRSAENLLWVLPCLCHNLRNLWTPFPIC